MATQPILEPELERRLVEKIKRFLLELGKGFTFIGNQYELDFNGRTNKVDLLFFPRGLRSLVAIDLKIESSVHFWCRFYKRKNLNLFNNQEIETYLMRRVRKSPFCCTLSYFDAGRPHR